MITIFEDFGIDYLGPVDGHNIVEIDKSIATCTKE